MTLKRASRRRAGNGVEKRRDPAEGTRLIKHEGIEHQSRRYAEIDDVGERIHLGAELGRSLHHAGHTPVDAVKKGCYEHHHDGKLETVFKGQTNTGQTGTDGENCDDIGNDDTQGYLRQLRAAR